MTSPALDTPFLLHEKSDPLMVAAAQAGFSIADAMQLGFSPIAVKCNEAWKPLLERVCERVGYCWEWAPDPGQPPLEEVPSYVSRNGEAVLTKIE